MLGPGGYAATLGPGGKSATPGPGRVGRDGRSGRPGRGGHGRRGRLQRDPERGDRHGGGGVLAAVVHSVPPKVWWCGETTVAGRCRSAPEQAMLNSGRPN